ncbi:hypothetical protein X801_02796 [Opisthorchis viverrini]|uniref:Integrase zinc-binding domain-containing protein n=1 Tax=Opisthorchis viverrini TaxID=6198 RepID=A0A1S8X3K3_OPIVI|nr:hypothetical protein X801_02796 [Opisthorchis viverrini]
MYGPEIINEPKIVVSPLTPGRIPNVVELKRSRITTTTQTLRKLCPILLDGILCVGGRLHYSSYALSLRHPPMLPNKHPVTGLLFRHYHGAEGHSSASHALGVFRLNVRIVHGSQAVRRVLHKCNQCKKGSRNKSAGGGSVTPGAACKG